MFDDENKVQPEPGQTPIGATELLDIPEDKLSGLPKEVVDLHTNAKAAIAASTKRNQEVAEKERRLAVDKEYLDKQREELLAEREKFYGQLQEQYSKPFQPNPQTSSTPEPSFEVDPLGAYKNLQDKTARLEKEQRTRVEELEKKIVATEQKLTTTQSAVSFQRFFDREITPNFPKVSEKDLDVWLDAHPGVQPNFETAKRAAQEITDSKNAELEVRWQEYQKEKEAKAKEATIPGKGNVGAPKPIKDWNDLTDEEQAAVMSEDAKRLSALRGE